MLHPSRRIPVVLAVLALIVGMDPLLAGPQREAGKYTMVSIPPLKTPWFDRLEIGLKKAGEELGVDVRQQAPLTPDGAQQTKLVEDAINQGANAILVIPSDPKTIENSLAQAQSKKIVTITHQSPQQANADFDIEMIDNKAFGEKAMEEMVKAMGSAEGEYVVYVGSLTLPAHNLWADAAVALARQKYPGLKLVADRFPVSEDMSLARQISLDIIAAHPSIRGILAFGSQGGPGAAEAVREKGLIGRIAVIGTTAPNLAAPYLKDGSLSASILWDPAEAGYAMVYLAALVLNGKKAMIGPDLELPTLGKPLLFKGNTLVYDRPIVLTSENVDSYAGF